MNSSDEETDMSFMNEASWDRIARVGIGVVLLIVGLAIVGTLGIVLAVLGAILLVTGLIGWCPIYAAFRTRTNQG